MWQKALLFLISGILSVFAGELLARWYLLDQPNGGFENPKAYYERQAGLAPWQGGNWLRGLVPHPYFGFVLRPEDSAANNYGFREPEWFPYEKKQPDELVIGVLGGSVAMMWAGWAQGDPDFVSSLRSKVPALRGRPIKILNLALAGYRQPQQFFVASYFAPMVDLFLNIEGHNELEAYTNQPLYPVEYPAGAYLTFAATRSAVEKSRMLIFYSGLNSWMMETGLKNGILRKSALFFLAANGVFRWTSKTSARVAEEAKKEQGRELDHPRFSFYSEKSRTRDAVQAAISVWERFSFQQHLLLGSLGKKGIFFLQPNQYMPASKELSPWEREFAINKNYLAKAHGYARLPEVVRRLRSRKMNIHDLTMIFSRESRTVYTDNCCHLNELGNEIMAEEIAKRVAETVRF